VRVERVVILDGYTDEPAGLGVPPYINTYPRLVAGVVWLKNKSATVRYWTIDQARADMSKFLEEARRADLVVVIAGSEVPGKYIGGVPITREELERIALLLRDVRKILAGPAARYGLASGGGSVAVEPSKMRSLFDEVVSGDIEEYLNELLEHGFERARPWIMRENYELANRAFVVGAKIVREHPCYGKNLVVELETFRGCPRWISGGCSFCIEPRYGRPIMRDTHAIIKEVEVLYELGVRHIRVGKQPDILVYMAHGVGEEEFPKPNVEALERLFRGIRLVAPGLITLHIDNVNPGTVAKYPEESTRALKVIVKYNTPGDVAALGVESFDPRVIKLNNLKASPEESLEAIRIINRVGILRGWNGLPYLLPGINLLYGLPGETRETYAINEEYLKRILEEGLLVRRVNIRQVAVLVNTPLWLKRSEVQRLLRKHRRIFHSHRVRVMRFFDRVMLSRIAPENTLLYYLYTEKYIRGFTIARFPGSYPIAVKIPGRVKLGEFVTIRVLKHASKSVLGAPLHSELSVPHNSN